MSSERKQIDVDEVKKTFRIKNGNLERLNYNYPNGKWTVVKNRKNQNGGYCRVGLNGGLVMYHNIIWILSTGKNIPQGLDIDHINGNKIDNRIENLRVVSHRINVQNRKEHRDGQLVGCAFCKRVKKYYSRIRINSKQIYLGYFKTEQEAHRAYAIACEHIADYKDNKSFRILIKREMEGK